MGDRIGANGRDDPRNGAGFQEKSGREAQNLPFLTRSQVHFLDRRSISVADSCMAGPNPMGHASRYDPERAFIRGQRLAVKTANWASKARLYAGRASARAT